MKASRRKVTDPKKFWRQLKALGQTVPRRDILEVRDKLDGKVKAGTEMVEVWREWFQKLLNPKVEVKDPTGLDERA